MNITTTPTLVVPKEIGNSDLQNTGTDIVYINSTAETCTSALGLVLNPGDAWFGQGPVYACTASGTGTLAVMLPSN